MQEELRTIHERNRRVEIDKAWESSKTRKGIISVMTYVVITLFLTLINAPHPYLNALIPTAGFLLSTLTMPYFKKIWIQKIYR